MDWTKRVSRMSCVLALVVVALGFSGAAYAADEGWLGVMLQPLSDEIIAAMNLQKGTAGVLVSDVVDDSPADEAGFEKGDIIVEIDGASISDVDGAIAKVKDLGPGSEVKMVVMRDGKKQVLSAVLGDRAQMAAKMESKEDVEDKDDDQGEAEENYYNFRIPRIERIFKDIKIGPGGYIGVEIRDLSADLGAYFGVGAGEGLLVLDVVEDSPADEAGLRAGDVIIRVDGEDVGSSGGFAGYVREREPGEKLDVTFKRNKETRRVTVEVGEGPDAARMFINQAGDPDAMTWMGEGSECCGQRCIQLGDKCIMRGECCMGQGRDCPRVCIMMKAEECKGKAKEYPMKAKEAQGEAMKCHKMMEEAKPEPAKFVERPSPEMIKSMKYGNDDLRVEMEQLKTEMERLQRELEALKKQ